MKRKEIVVINSTIALIFLLLTYTLNWLWIIPATILMMINWRLLVKK